MPFLTRRQTIAGIAATGGVAALGGGVAMVHDHRPDLVRSILNRSLGDFRMADDQFAALLAEIDKPFAPSSQRIAFYRAAAATGRNGLIGLVPARIGEEFEEYERRVVTTFMTRTDFLAINPLREEVRFVGGDTCTSPFARFD